MKKRKLYPYEAVVIALTMVTNCFIIAGVSRHWNYHDNNNTELAKALQEVAQVQEKASYGTGCQETYQNAN